MKWRIYKEEVEGVNIKKLLKQNGITKFPAKTEFNPDSVSWSKHGGHAGKNTLRKMCIELEHAGWKRGEWRTGGIPDGSAVSNSNTYISPDGQIVMEYYEHFGVTAYQNYYSFTFELVRAGVNESYEANEILHDTKEWDMFVVNIGWAGPEGYDDIEDWDEAGRAWDKFIEDNDLPMCVGMKFPKGMNVDIKHLLEKQYGLPVENYDIDRSKGAMEFQTPWLEWTPEGWQEKDEVEFVSESNDMNFKKLLKQNGVTKLPSGTQFKPDRVSWSKDGGYAGQKTLDKICSQLEDAGWERGEWRTGGVPDGSSVSNSNAYTSPDGQLVMTYSEHYGATAHDNFYGFTFKLAGNQVNEADDSFTRGDRPQIRKVFSDEEFTVDEFVERIQEAKEEIEDIIIFNRDMYENQDEPLKVFLTDVC